MQPPELRIAPLRRSLFRHATILGGERAPMMMVIVASVLLTLTAMTVFSFVVGVVILVIGVTGLRAAYKLHPRASIVYFEFLRYRRFYPARPKFALPMPHRKVCERGRRPPV